MDLLRIFIHTAFSTYPIEQQLENCRLPLKENIFVEETKRIHPELSDDHIRLLFRLYIDEWSKCPPAESDIFFTLIPFVKEVLCTDFQRPKLRLVHLFRWRELTQYVGEDLLVCASLAIKNIYKGIDVGFSWAPVLQADDIDFPNLSKGGLSDLHQHLKASTDIFRISWLCLMNRVRRRMGEFVSICSTREEASWLYTNYIEAAAIRVELTCCLIDRDHEIDYTNIQQIKQDALYGNLDKLDADISYLSNYRKVDFDYIFRYMSPVESGNIIYSSERWLLYKTLKRIFEGDDNALLTKLLWRYVVIKNQVRSKLIQNNENIGFGNFAGFEMRKQVFVKRYHAYLNLLIKQPIVEAARFYHASYLETRITPTSPRKQLYYELKDTKTQIDNSLKAANLNILPEYRFIYHFIKKKDNRSNCCKLPRNQNVRCEVYKQAIALKGLMEQYPRIGKCIVAIDAANSELFCRPEVFAQSFRYLRNTGLRRTFHVGEDSYDIVDGLRAVDEAVFFLQLERGDRLGHAIALGLSPEDYYHERNYTMPIPRQNLLDNLVWLYFKAKSYNIVVPPTLEIMIHEKFCELSKSYDIGESGINLIDYYHMMKLRGDNPMELGTAHKGYIIDCWDAYNLDERDEIGLCRKERIAKQLYYQYHFRKEVREDGEKVCGFKVNDDYVGLVRLLQEKMMSSLEFKGLVIECCPSSNYRIGRLRKYENHPIFRMKEVNPDGEHQMAVTINTDDLGIFTTSIVNEYSLILLALMKMKKDDGTSRYNTLYIQNWIAQLIRNGHKYSFSKVYDVNNNN